VRSALLVCRVRRAERVKAEVNDAKSSRAWTSSSRENRKHVMLERGTLKCALMSTPSQAGQKIKLARSAAAAAGRRRSF